MLLSSWRIRSPRLHILSLLLILFPFCLRAAPASVPTPDKTQTLRQRFEEGCKLAAQDRPGPALEVFAGILAEDPQARGSLLMSGIILNQQRRFADAAPFFERFARLEPDHEQGLIGTVKAYHSTGRAAEAEPYRLRLFQLRQMGKSPKLKVMASYEREIIGWEDGRWISVQEYFDAVDLRPKWAYLLMKDDKTIARRIQLNLLPEAEAKIARQANPALGQSRVYALSEPIYEGGTFVRTKIHRMVSGDTAYAEAKKMALDVFQAPVVAE